MSQQDEKGEGRALRRGRRRQGEERKEQEKQEEEHSFHGDYMSLGSRACADANQDGATSCCMESRCGIAVIAARQLQRVMWTASHPGTTIRPAAESGRLQRSLGHRLINLEGYWDGERKKLAFELWKRARGDYFEHPTISSHSPYFTDYHSWYHSPVDARGVDMRDLRNLERFRTIELGPRLQHRRHIWKFVGMPPLQDADEGAELYRSLVHPSMRSSSSSSNSSSSSSSAPSDTAESEEWFM